MSEKEKCEYSGAIYCAIFFSAMIILEIIIKIWIKNGM
jgi:hypothetical protein